MEKCYYLFHDDFETINRIDCHRVYIGHETCETRLPSYSVLKPMLKLLNERGIRLTLLTPFLTDEGLGTTKKLIEIIEKEAQELEVATSDWGLLHWLSINRVAKPLVGRLLTRQKTDPRLSLFSLGDELKLHISRLSLLKSETITFFNQHGINRFEISSALSEYQLPNDGMNRFSLHVPYIPVTVMRWCIGQNLDFNFPDQDCSVSSCQGTFQAWEAKPGNHNYFRIDNALFYLQDREPDFGKHVSIDRIVINLKYKFDC